MATNNQTPQPEEQAVELVDIADLRQQNNISWAVFAGVCSENNWKPGKAVTKEAFLSAVKKFTGAPMNGKSEREAKG